MKYFTNSIPCGRDGPSLATREIIALERLVCEFGRAMLSRLEKKIAEGKGGWDDPEWTESMIRQRIQEASLNIQDREFQEVDIANYCAFLWNRRKND